jgi:hypothetical protein
MGVLAFILFDSPRSTESTAGHLHKNKSFPGEHFAFVGERSLLGTVGRNVCVGVCNEGMIVTFEKTIFFSCIFIDWAHACGCSQTEMRCKLMHKIDE